MHLLNMVLSRYIVKLAWEPSVPQFTHSYFRRLPALGRKLRFYLFFSIKVDQLKTQNLAKKISRDFSDFPYKNLRQILIGLKFY